MTSAGPDTKFTDALSAAVRQTVRQVAWHHGFGDTPQHRADVGLLLVFLGCHYFSLVSATNASRNSAAAEELERQIRRFFPDLRVSVAKEVQE